MGYWPQQVADLEATINAVDAGEGKEPGCRLESDPLAHCTHSPSRAVNPSPLPTPPPTTTTTTQDTVLIATPFDLSRLCRLNKPVAVASYAIRDRAPPLLSEEVCTNSWQQP